MCLTHYACPQHRWREVGQEHSKDLDRLVNVNLFLGRTRDNLIALIASRRISIPRPFVRHALDFTEQIKFAPFFQPLWLRHQRLYSIWLRNIENHKLIQ